MITYDGEVIGEEVMFTKGTIAGMLDGNSMASTHFIVTPRGATCLATEMCPGTCNNGCAV